MPDCDTGGRVTAPSNEWVIIVANTSSIPVTIRATAIRAAP